MIVFELVTALDLLRRTPAVLAAMLVGIDDQLSRATEGPDTFSVYDNVGHLIDGEEADWMMRAEQMRSSDSRIRFAPYDRFRHRERNVGRSLDSLLAEFAALRAKNVALLVSWELRADQLAIVAEHPSLGEVTLQQLLAAHVVHDLGHIAQVARVVAKQYRREIGAWEQYLPIVTDRPSPIS